jgi:hypothetical protein
MCRDGNALGSMKPLAVQIDTFDNGRHSLRHDRRSTSGIIFAFPAERLAGISSCNQSLWQVHRTASRLGAWLVGLPGLRLSDFWL